MKKIIYIIVVALLTTFFVGCEDMLDLYPEDAVSKEVFFSNQNDFELALVGLYSGLRSYDVKSNDATYGGNLFWDVCSDALYYQMSWFQPWYDISRGNVNPNTDKVDFLWRNAYQTINWANTIIEQFEIKRDVLSDDFARYVEGEARFIRAISYLRLTSVYGAVPMVDKVLTPSEAKLPRTSVEEITNNLIIPDLNIAIENLEEMPYRNQWGKATKQAAMGMKVRALLYNKDYQATTQAAEELMAFADNSRVGFEPVFDRIFANDNENNGEILFSIKYRANGSKEGGSYSTPFGPKTIPSLDPSSINGSWQASAISPEYIESFYMVDGLPASESPLYDEANPWANRGPRFESTFYIGDYSVLSTGQQITTAMIGTFNADYKNKYPFNVDKGYMNEDIKLNWNFEDESDFIVLRYTDVLLMYVEAKIELNQLDNSVYDIVNMVRARAGIAPIAYGLGQSELREILRLERKLEFAFEGIRYFDIRRWRIAEEVFAAINSDDPANGGYNFGSQKKFLPSNYLWPIPQTAIDVNPNLAPNNTGY